MKKVSILLICAVAISLIFIGKIQYDKKITQAGKVTAQSQNDDPSKNSILFELTNNMSKDLQDNVITKLRSEEVIDILIVGSEAIMNGDANNLPWPLQVKNALEENYGQDIFNLDVMNFENITTNHLIETKGHEQIAAAKSDILIIEPLLLNDNGFVKVEDTLQNLETIIDTVKQLNPETYIIIQPPNPIFEPVTYLDQVNALKEFTTQNNIEYFNHWQDWPDTSSDNIKETLQGTFPNANGQNIWADYIIKYFVSK